MPANKQLQRTVRDKVPSHIGQHAAAELQRYTTMKCRWVARLLVSFVLSNGALAIADESNDGTALRKLVAAQQTVEVARQGKLVTPVFPTLAYVDLRELRSLSRDVLVRSLGAGSSCPHAAKYVSCLLWPMSYLPPLYDGPGQSLVAELDATDHCVDAFIVPTQ